MPIVESGGRMSLDKLYDNEPRKTNENTSLYLAFIINVK